MKIKLWAPDNNERPARAMIQPETHAEWIVMQRISKLVKDGATFGAGQTGDEWDGALSFELVWDEAGDPKQ